MNSVSIKGGGGGGGVGGGGWGREEFRPIILENLILRYESNGKARSCPHIFRVVLGPCGQCCPCEASEQKWGKNKANFFWRPKNSALCYLRNLVL